MSAPSVRFGMDAVQEHRRATRVIAAVVARTLRAGHRVRQVAEDHDLVLVRLERRQDRRELQRALRSAGVQFAITAPCGMKQNPSRSLRRGGGLRQRRQRRHHGLEQRQRQRRRPTPRRNVRREQVLLEMTTAHSWPPSSGTACSATMPSTMDEKRKSLAPGVPDDLAHRRHVVVLEAAPERVGQHLLGHDADEDLRLRRRVSGAARRRRPPWRR